MNSSGKIDNKKRQQFQPKKEEESIRGRQVESRKEYVRGRASTQEGRQRKSGHA